MELMIIPQNSIDSFDFHSVMTSPQISPPMTPKRFGQSYFSAPTSPSRVSELYQMYDYDQEMSKIGVNDDLIEFDFQFCGDTLLSSADDLFDGGKIKIKPLKSLQRSEQRRGRATGSVSPLRNGAVSEKQDDLEQSNAIEKAALTKSSSVFRKWRLKDFLLFRSASEGRASNKFPSKKFGNFRKDGEDCKSTSFRSADGSFGSQDGMRKKSQMSAHEMHYTKNKAASENLKKKTYLPYKQGIFARLF